jgi:hypothetical protein
VIAVIAVAVIRNVKFYWFIEKKSKKVKKHSSKHKKDRKRSGSDSSAWPWLPIIRLYEIRDKSDKVITQKRASLTHWAEKLVCRIEVVGYWVFASLSHSTFLIILTYLLGMHYSNQRIPSEVMQNPYVNNINQSKPNQYSEYTTYNYHNNNIQSPSIKDTLSRTNV